MPLMRYKRDVLDELARHGLRPQPGTSAALLRKQIHDLYLHEIRTLRDRCKAGEFPRRELAGHVVALRRRYALLSTPESEWMQRE
jgi:hypothetical protein